MHPLIGNMVNPVFNYIDSKGARVAHHSGGPDDDDHPVAKKIMGEIDWNKKAAYLRSQQIAERNAMTPSARRRLPPLAQERRMPEFNLARDNMDITLTYADNV